jgi:serine protease Do
LSLFDDDFYSTKIKRSSRWTEQAGMGTGRGSLRIPAAFRIAIVSSLVSAFAVSFLFLLITGTRSPEPSARPALAGGQTLVETSERMISASGKIRPAVVSIVNYTQETGSEEFGTYSGRYQELPEYASLGSGVIFKKKGGKAYIITNAHVIAGAVKINAVLIDGTRKEAKLVGKDSISDIAVLSVDDKGIDVVAEIGSSSNLRVGEMVIAVGNPLGFGDSVTNGIVSFLHRIVPVSLNQDGIYDWEQEVIQTTAAINQGNSGGVLADLEGRVVGINSMKIADTGVEGLGFAIPIDNVMPVVEQIMKYGKVLRPYMGVFSVDLDIYLEFPGYMSGEEGKDGKGEAEPVIPEGVKEGALVLEAVGPAKEAGLRFNDIITELDGKPISGTLDLRKYLYNEKKIGDTLTVTYYRGGKKAETRLTLTEKDAE